MRCSLFPVLPPYKGGQDKTQREFKPGLRPLGISNPINRNARIAEADGKKSANQECGSQCVFRPYAFATASRSSIILFRRFA